MLSRLATSLSRLTRWRGAVDPPSSTKTQPKQYIQNEQERLDTFKAFLATNTYYQHMNSLSNKTKEEIEQLDKERQERNDKDEQDDEESLNEYMKDLMKTSYIDQKRRIGEVVGTQMLDLFEYVHKIGGLNSYPPPIQKLPLNSMEAKLRRALIIKESNLEGVTFDHPDGFKLRVGRSGIGHDQAGYGVHVVGTVVPGTVLAIYPGDTYSANTITPGIIKDNDYAIARYDGTVIDGRSWLKKTDMSVYRPQYFNETGSSGDGGVGLLKYRNPFAIGQFINHPAEGQRPNVIGIKYNFSADFPEHLKPYIPNMEMFENRFLRDGNIFVKSFVIIAYEQINDGELLLNYRFNPDNPYPDWYHQPDLEEAKRRWGQVEDRFSLNTIASRLL
ncbi:hypothetical protein SAMD00019534_112280 [Acytostelium subglobosum LB1]|uniref:hypothetical protein n=1 Tax=Acytostelium subglobosum LB1 TaxID=1410327 RepID=UPI000644FFB2|nr:hypothetical protein SAMD00019534_112280 [Acytostelium subglobosum LB1]GAM28052.1 hypothetical protein SAMD00019534_112280 [Acytostelium subglobosum LB1]|eukprot:XP_012749011.1 hypothetical protein SAMD00019534_112280 [Acytostelium subglobosum LB1]